MVSKEKPKSIAWEVLLLKASPAMLIGVVCAPTEEEALQLAIEQFEIKPQDHWRLIVRRQ